MRSDDIEKSDFEPSMKILPRIMRIILENESMNRTTLAQATNLNYARLCKYVVWLEKKSFIEFSISNGKLIIKLTECGREFALKLARLPD
ncbi:MAG: winged helix-turn-helix domain-containing protein [Thermoproteota archaeon]